MPRSDGGVVLRYFATGNRNDDVAETRTSTLREGSELGPGKAFMRSTKSWALCALTGRAACCDR